MHIEFLVEEYSAEALLNNLLPLMLPGETTYAIHVFSGKPDLLVKLPKRLRGYRKWLPDDWRIVVLVDKAVTPFWPGLPIGSTTGPGFRLASKRPLPAFLSKDSEESTISLRRGKK